MPDQLKPRVIKRYANRKLYDMSESCYITHDEIARLVKDGVEVRIIDNRTKEDLTTLTLTQILFKEEKKQRKTLPLQTLRGILQSGGDFIQRHITQPVDRIRDEAEETVRKVLRRGDDVPAAGEDDADALGPMDGSAQRGGAAEAARDWLDNTQKSFEHLQRTLEERWTLILNSMGLLDANEKRIAELERRVAELEARLGGAEDSTGVASEGSGDDEA
jgi:polyhydroxyalkanoate synthesis repressor PhaR